MEHFKQVFRMARKHLSKLALISTYVLSSGLIISCGGSSSQLQPELPSFVSLIQNQPVESSAQNNLATPVADNQFLFNTSAAQITYDSYQNTTYNIGNPGDQPLQYANRLLCLANQLQPQQNVDGVAYRGLVDFGRCYGEGSYQDYQPVVAKVSQQSSGLQIDLWWDETDSTQSRARFLIEQSSSVNNPYGQFQLFHRRTSDFSSLPSSSATDKKTWLSVSLDPRNSQQYVMKLLTFDGSLASANQLNKAIYLAALNGLSGQYHIDAEVDEKTAFDSAFIHSEKSGDARCYDLAQMRCDMMGYALFYDQDAIDGSFAQGDMVAMQPGFAFTYTANAQLLTGYVDGAGVWTDQPLAGGVAITITDQNQQNYYLTPSNNASQATVEKILPDSTTQTISLSQPIEFSYTYDANDMGSSAGSMPGTHSLSYFGDGTMGFFDTNGDALNFNNGTQLTANNINYKIRSSQVLQNAVQITSSLPAACEALDLPDFGVLLDSLSFSADLDASFISQPMPEVTEMVKYVAGVGAE
ncbi:hypothetical protein DC094_15175 [Pelagibaculum spongiae]|uniref:Uncharacterized protein n=2 Tax=Pelagibaculum spongiae TaxID=2080658 RepID=A0A2V1GZ36_9GAMM|nr:hypothetical protein DC094_15175 [Pelagibaculum spongiae]